MGMMDGNHSEMFEVCNRQLQEHETAASKGNGRL